MNQNFGKATNVIERSGEHNKNLDAPFIPRASLPTEPITPIILPNRTPASIRQEFKRPNNSANNLYYFLAQQQQQHEQPELTTVTAEPSRRIENFNMYQDYLHRNNIDSTFMPLQQRNLDEYEREMTTDEEELKLAQQAPDSYQTARMTPKSSISSSSGSDSTNNKSKKSVGFDMKPRILYPDEDAEITKILS